MKKKLLWVGDAVASTGFAKSTHRITDILQESGDYEVYILGLNYHGDPVMSGWPYKVSRDRVFPCMPGGDYLGVNRVRGIADDIGADVVVIQNDPWNFDGYMRRLRGLTKDGARVPVIGYVAIDGRNAAGTLLNGLDLAIFWTEFAEREARAGGFVGRSAVVPLGVDLGAYRPPTDRHGLRQRLLGKALADRGLPPETFVVGVVARNQWRKRLDLTVQYFAEWVERRDVEAALWVHSAPTRDDAWDISNLADVFGLTTPVDRLLLPYIPKDIHGVKESTMAEIYGIFDVLFTTTLGEGFWLPGFEAAACGTPIIAPKWSAIEEFFTNAALLVECSSIAIHPSQTNTIGGVMDKDAAIVALDDMYADHDLRRETARRGMERVHEDRFRWDVQGARFLGLVNQVMADQVAPLETSEVAHAQV